MEYVWFQTMIHIIYFSIVTLLTMNLKQNSYL